MPKIIQLCLFIIMLFGVSFSNEYPLKIYHGGDIGSRAGNFKIMCERAKDAGYTHVTYSVNMRLGFKYDEGADTIISSVWRNGIYTGGSSGRVVSELVERFKIADSLGLRLIPVLPSANKWSGAQWTVADNDSISYQPIYRENLDEKAKEDLKSDVKYLSFINKFAGFYGDNAGCQVSVSGVPSYAENSSGLAKTYKSLIKDVVKVAFDEFQKSPVASYSNLDYIHMGNDEVLLYDPLISKKDGVRNV